MIRPQTGLVHWAKLSISAIAKFGLLVLTLAESTVSAMGAGELCGPNHPSCL